MFRSLLCISLILLSACGRHRSEPFTLGLKGAEGAQKQSQKELMLSAIEKNEVTAIEALLKEGFDLSTDLSEGKTALHISVERDRPLIVQVLLAAGADPDLKDAAGKSPRDLAAGNLDLEMIFDPELGTQLRAEMMAAVRAPNKETLMELLVTRKMGPNFIEEESGETPLTFILKNKVSALYRTILHHDARTDVNLPNRDGINDE